MEQHISQSVITLNKSVCDKRNKHYKLHKEPAAL